VWGGENTGDEEEEEGFSVVATLVHLWGAWIGGWMTVNTCGRNNSDKRWRGELGWVVGVEEVGAVRGAARRDRGSLILQCMRGAWFGGFASASEQVSVCCIIFSVAKYSHCTTT
jgi:hypothetical protein